MKGKQGTEQLPDSQRLIQCPSGKEPTQKRCDKDLQSHK